MNEKKVNAAPSKLRIIPLGGIGEIGKNMTVVEYEDDMIVIDCGNRFPGPVEAPGVDIFIPDDSYVVSKRKNMRGYLLTHGHEDHIGAIPYILRDVPAPIYGTKLTLALVEIKLKEHRISNIPLHVVKPLDEFTLGKFKIQFIHVNHSVAGACAIAVTCPAGTVIFTGDFKVDYTPVDGQVTDLQTLAAYGVKGTMCLLCDSTNVGRPGSTMSERKIGKTFEDIFAQASGRVIVAMFASNVHRMQMVIDNAVRYGRRVCFIGRSMVNVSRVAMQIGELVIPENCLIDMDSLDAYPDEEILVMTTGSQGEPMAGLTRMAFAEHRKLQIRQSDTVVISASPIPGNEREVGRVIDQLYRCGAKVIYSALAEVHASGHACQEELKLIHALVRPQYFIPLHGEFRMLLQHAELAASMGMDPKNIVIPDNDVSAGTVTAVEMDANGISYGEKVPIGEVLVDGLGVGDVGNVVLRDRKHLSQEGLIIACMVVDRDEGKLLSGPDVISRGFIYVRENEEIISNVREIARTIITSSDLRQGDLSDVKNRIKDETHRYIFEKIKRNPMVLPIILDV